MYVCSPDDRRGSNSREWESGLTAVTVGVCIFVRHAPLADSPETPTVFLSIWDSGQLHVDVEARVFLSGESYTTRRD